MVSYLCREESRAKKAAAREKKDLCGGKRSSREGGGSARRRRGLYGEIFINLPLIKLSGNGREKCENIDICGRGGYNKTMNVYLDYAATTPVRREVREAMLPFLTDNFGNPDSLHAFGRRAAYAVAEARAKIAEICGVSAGEVYFTSGGTEADNQAVRCLGEGRALVSAIEHAAVLSAAPMRAGGSEVFPVNGNGACDLNGLAARADAGAGLVCLMAVNNETGCVQPVEEAAKLTKTRNILLFCDCVQAACSQDLREILRHADAISLSAHKIGGAKGTGALIVKKGVRLAPLIAGGEQERGLRGGTLNVAGIAGFARALELAQAEREEFCAQTGARRDLFEALLRQNWGDGVRFDGENRAPNISHVTFARGGDAFLNALDLKGVAASGGAACSAHASLPSHVMLAMGRSEAEAKRGVRFSFGRETTEEEVRFAARTVGELLRG